MRCTAPHCGARPAGRIVLLETVATGRKRFVCSRRRSLSLFPTKFFKFTFFTMVKATAKTGAAGAPPEDPAHQDPVPGGSGAAAPVDASSDFSGYHGYHSPPRAPRSSQGAASAPGSGDAGPDLRASPYPPRRARARAAPASGAGFQIFDVPATLPDEEEDDDDDDVSEDELAPAAKKRAKERRPPPTDRYFGPDYDRFDPSAPQKGAPLLFLGDLSVAEQGAPPLVPRSSNEQGVPFLAPWASCGGAEKGAPASGAPGLERRAPEGGEAFPVRVRGVVPSPRLGRRGVPGSSPRRCPLWRRAPEGGEGGRFESDLASPSGGGRRGHRNCEFAVRCPLGRW